MECSISVIYALGQMEEGSDDDDVTECALIYPAAGS
jgi:hypothetical protein